MLRAPPINTALQAYIIHELAKGRCSRDVLQHRSRHDPSLKPTPSASEFDAVLKIVADKTDQHYHLKPECEKDVDIDGWKGYRFDLDLDLDRYLSLLHACSLF